MNTWRSETFRFQPDTSLRITISFCNVGIAISSVQSVLNTKARVIGRCCGQFYHNFCKWLFCFVVAICVLVHNVEAKHGLYYKQLTSAFLKYNECPGMAYPLLQLKQHWISSWVPSGFSYFDLQACYWQVEVEEQDRRQHWGRACSNLR